MLSIFATPDEARAFAQEHGVGIPRRPLKANTLRRIARGLMKYVLGARRPFLVNIQNYGWDSSPVGSVDRPLPTITGNPKGGAFALADVTVAPFCATLNHGGPESRANRLDRPLATVCGANDARAIVAAFLTTYYGNGGESSPADSLPTCTGHDRIGLVTALIDGQTYVVTDVAMRMLTPRELARAQGFPDDYVIDRDADGHPISKAYQVKLIGNSVCPPVARAIVRANVVEQGVLDDVMETAAA